VAEAEGDAQATLVRAKAQAEANQALQQSPPPPPGRRRWNGVLPQFTGGGPVPFVNLKELAAEGPAPR
jgi:hypothetical protein